VTTAAHYHVWCLSWDDEEEYGSDVVGYDIFCHDFKTEKRGIVYVPSTTLYDAKAAAEAYADYAYRQRDGWESTWPLVFRVRGSDGQVTDFDVDCQHVPEFSASPLERPADLCADSCERCDATCRQVEDAVRRVPCPKHGTTRWQRELDAIAAGEAL